MKKEDAGREGKMKGKGKGRKKEKRERERKKRGKRKSYEVNHDEEKNCINDKG